MAEHEPAILAGADGESLRLVDPIEGVEFSIYADESLRPDPVAVDSLAVPVPLDAAAAVTAATLVVPKLPELLLREATFDLRSTVTVEASDGTDERLLAESVPAGTVIEFSTAPMKIYAVPDAAFDVVRDGDHLRIEFESPAEIRVGVRSFHRRPAATIQVTEDPEDVMAAVSYFGSALKTESPERSFGSLRGHPPVVELGESFSAPAGLSTPATGIEIGVPATLERVLPVASLAYYLGAEVVPASDPQLVAAGRTYALDGEDGFEQVVNDTLRRVFLLDAITRTEGLYPVQLHAREQLEARLPFDPDFGRLYDLPIAERVAAYLAPRFDAVEELLPDWHLATDLAPTGESVRMLPYVADELSLVRSEGRREPLDVTGVPDELADFYRGAGDAARSGQPDGPRHRGGDEPRPVGTLLDEEVFTPVEVDARSLQWVGDGVPAGATKAIVESYERRSDREPTSPEDHRISIGIVCNDPTMADEIGDSLYGSRDLLEFDVDVHEEVTADELRELLQTPYDFLHYVGHTTPAGIQCAEDTVLDARTLDDVAVDSFFLNSCESYEQGRALVERGSGAGAVTLSPVDDATATEAGHRFAKLLNGGFTFRSALAVLQQQSLLGHRYSVIGDGGLQLVQAAGGTPYFTSVTRGQDPTELEVAVEYRPTLRRPVGSLVSLSIPAFDGHYLDLETVGPAAVSWESLRTFLALDEVPVLTDGTLRWSSEFDPTRDDPS